MMHKLLAALTLTTLLAAPAHADGMVRPNVEPHETPLRLDPRLGWGVNQNNWPGYSPNCREFEEGEQILSRIANAEPVRRLQESEARNFLNSAWDGNPLLEDGIKYAYLDTVFVRSPPEYPGWSRIYLGSTVNRVICGFSGTEALVLNRKHVEAGLRADPPQVRWRRPGDLWPNMSTADRQGWEGLKGFIGGLMQGQIDTNFLFPPVIRMTPPVGGLPPAPVQPPLPFVPDGRYDPLYSGPRGVLQGEVSDCALRPRWDEYCIGRRW